MHAAVKAKGAEATDRELALELASLMLHCFRGRGNDVLRVIDESGLSLVQMKTVIAISSHELPKETTVTALSETLGVSPASASRAVDGLVKQKLASRVEDAEDRRVRRVTLTAKGQSWPTGSSRPAWPASRTSPRRSTTSSAGSWPPRWRR